LNKYKIILFFILFSSYGYSKEIARYSIYRQIFTIDEKSNSFKKDIFARGSFNDLEFKAEIYFGELEKVENAEAFYEQKGKKKKVDKSNFYQSDIISDSFYDGYKAYKIKYQNSDKNKNPQNFEYKVSLINSEVFCFSTINFYQTEEYSIDTFINVVYVPKEYNLLINDKDIKKDFQLIIDSNDIGNAMVYTFKKVFKSVDAKVNDREKEFISIRVLVYPKDKEPLKHFNNWYQNLLTSISPSEKYKPICDSLSTIHSNKDSLIKSVFNFVVKKIRYINIENGINAFRPRPSDDVLYKLQGDCKDMALLLTNMYTYLGFDANIALSSTLSNEFQFDFPTIASANHAICILNYNNKYYYLDATERFGSYDQPSQQIQSTKAMISKPSNAYIIEIPKRDASFNTTISTYNIKIEPSTIKGQFKHEYNGYSKIIIENITKDFSSSKSKQILKKYYQDNKFNLTYDNLVFDNSDNKIVIKGDIDINPTVLSKIDNKIYFNFNFCPYIHNFKEEIDTTENYPLYRTSKNVNIITIEFPNTIKKVESIYNNYSTTENGITYQFSIKHFENKLQIEYKYENPYVILSKHIIPSYNKINQKITNTLNHEIIIY
jgi:hypothetical protein